MGNYYSRINLFKKITQNKSPIILIMKQKMQTTATLNIERRLPEKKFK